MPADTAVVDVPTTSTPASAPTSSGTPASPAATPATSAATPVAPASERPKDAKSLANFMRAADAAADATTPQSPLVADSAAAAITPSTSAPVAGVTDPNTSQGPIPFTVHQTALNNARTKAVQDFQRTHWSSKVSEQQINEIRDLSIRMSTDPVGFHRWLGEQLQQHPQFRQQVTTAATSAAPKTKPQPDVQIRDDAGNIVGMSYSAERQAELLSWQATELTDRFNGMVQPLVKDREERIAKQEAAEFDTAVKSGADQVIGQINDILDGREDLGPHVSALMAQGHDAISAALAVRKQYIVPAAKASAEAAVLDANRKKAAGNTASPGVAPGMPKPGQMTEKQLSKLLAQMDGQA